MNGGSAKVGHVTLSSSNNIGFRETQLEPIPTSTLTSGILNYYLLNYPLALSFFLTTVFTETLTLRDSMRNSKRVFYSLRQLPINVYQWYFRVSYFI